MNVLKKFSGSLLSVAPAVLLASVALIFLPNFARAQSVEPRSITVGGEGISRGNPDLVELSITVSTEAKTADEAVRTNATTTTKVIQQLKSKTPQVETASFSLQPMLDYQSGSRPRTTGFVASNTLRVRSDDLRAAGALLDLAVSTGANQIAGISFRLKDETRLREEALAEATKAARRKADVIAKAAGLTITEVLSITNAAQHAGPFPRDLAFAVAERASTPLEPGALEIRESVVLRVGVR